MASHVRLLTAPTADTGGTLIQLHHDEPGSYLFGNVSEGTQRAMVQRKFPPARIRQIFLSGPVSWHNIGGLLGLIITIADVRTSSIEQSDTTTRKGKINIGKHFSDLVIHGGHNLKYALAAARSFIFRKGLPLKISEVSSDPRELNPDSAEPDYKDNWTRVWYVPLFADGPPKSPSSSRKRSHEEMDDVDESNKVLKGIEGECRLIDEAVKGMFDPEWSMDKLEPISLEDAPPGVKLFVKNQNNQMEPYTGDKAADLAAKRNPLVFVRTKWPAANIHTLPPAKPVRQSMCYIVKNCDRRGKFRAQEAKSLGVIPKDFSKLTSGQSVTVAGGITVTPEQVLEPTIEGSGFAVLDIPDECYIPAFLARPEWNNNEIFKNIEKIHWILGDGLVQDPRIQEFMRTHHKIRHSVASRDVCSNKIAYKSAAETQVRHNHIDPDRFPILDFNNDPKQYPPALRPGSHEQLYKATEAGEMLQLVPRTMESDQFLEPNVDLAAALGPLSKRTIHFAGRAQQKIRKPDFLAKIEEAERDIPNRDMEVIALGTGSALPSKHRNVSGTLVRVPGVGSYLFDCGENTLGTLRRMLGAEGANEVLRDLRSIWLSHVHADHHLGTISVIRAWRDATQHMSPQPRLLLSSGPNMLRYFEEYKQIEDFGYDRVVFGLTKDQAIDERVGSYGSQNEVDMAEFGLKKISACKVQHCLMAAATVYEWPSGLKVAYSGDCRPSDNFAQMAQGATLLIHEATFEDELQGEAIAKRHCTMAEALGVARKMNARRVLLTHFSQRYPKFPNWESATPTVGEGGVQHEMVVLLAFDCMRVKLGDFKKAAEFLPALDSAYKEIEVEEKEEIEAAQPKPNQKGQTPKKQKRPSVPNHTTITRGTNSTITSNNSFTHSSPPKKSQSPRQSQPTTPGDQPKRLGRQDRAKQNMEKAHQRRQSASPSRKDGSKTDEERSPHGAASF